MSKWSKEEIEAMGFTSEIPHKQTALPVIGAADRVTAANKGTDSRGSLFRGDVPMWAINLCEAQAACDHNAHLLCTSASPS